MKIESLLLRREPPDDEAWLALGPDAPAILVAMIDDASVCRRTALRQRVIATLGQLQVKSGISRLSEILAARAEDEITPYVRRQRPGQNAGSGRHPGAGRCNQRR